MKGDPSHESALSSTQEQSSPSSVLPVSLKIITFNSLEERDAHDRLRRAKWLDLFAGEP